MYWILSSLSRLLIKILTIRWWTIFSLSPLFFFQTPQRWLVHQVLIMLWLVEWWLLLSLSCCASSLFSADTSSDTKVKKTPHIPHAQQDSVIECCSVKNNQETEPHFYLDCQLYYGQEADNRGTLNADFLLNTAKEKKCSTAIKTEVKAKKEGTYIVEKINQNSLS